MKRKSGSQLDSGTILVDPYTHALWVFIKIKMRNGGFVLKALRNSHVMNYGEVRHFLEAVELREYLASKSSDL